MSFYQQKDQAIFMNPESAYLTPLNGTIVTQNPTTYPWYSKLNIITDGNDWVMPIRIKEKLWGIGSGKHPDHIVNTEFAPVDFTLETLHQDARFLALAGGTCTSAGTQAIVQTITIDTYSDYVDGDQFLFYAIDASGHVICYNVYMDVTGDDSGATTVTGATATRIDFVTGDGSNNQTTTTVSSQATLAAEIEAVLQGLATVTTCDVVGNIITVTTVPNTGAVPLARDDSGNTGVTTFAWTTLGASTHTFTESTTNTMKSFGLHIEQLNSGQNMIADLYGCVVTSYEISIDYANKLVKETVGIRCPYYVVGAASVFYPPRRTGMNPATFGDFIEVSGSSEYIIMDATTSRTPTITNTVTLNIENEIELFPAIGANYRKNVVAGKRSITMTITGFAQTSSLWTHWKDTWDDTAQQYTNATGKLNSQLQIERESTYDEWKLSIYNWMIDEHSLRLIPIDDKIVGISITFSGATPDSNKRLMDALVIKDYMEKLVYGVANA